MKDDDQASLQLGDAERARVRRRTLPDRPAPMLATLTHDPFSADDWLYERKLDGIRCLAVRAGDGATLRSRSGESMNTRFPELVAAVEAAADRPFVADGEIVAFEDRGRRTSFARLQNRRPPDGAGDGRPIAVWLYVFDLLQWGDCDLRALPLERRKSLLKRMLDFGGRLRFTPHRRGGGEAWLEEACRKGWEGLIAKRADSEYTGDRSRLWLKFKCDHRQEFVIGGYTDPQGERPGFGALLLGVYDDGELRYCGKVGTGFDDDLLEQLQRRLAARARKTPAFADPPDGDGLHWVRPELVAEVAFTEWTRAGRLRHPRFIAERHDKPADDVQREDTRARAR